MNQVALGVLIGVGVLLLLIIVMYNSLVSKRNTVRMTFAGIDVQLKKRYDLIPSLVETVKGYMQHERDLLVRLVELRNIPYSRMNGQQKQELDKGVGQVMDGIRVAFERYPDLKASTNMLHLQRTLTETEEQLSAARRSYNAAVMQYNNSTQSFPGNMIAGMFGFRQEMFYEARSEERENVSINF